MLFRSDAEARDRYRGADGARVRDGERERRAYPDDQEFGRIPGPERPISRSDARERPLDDYPLPRRGEESLREDVERYPVDRERVDRERVDRERLDRERLERDRVERDRLERERVERDRIERDRLDRERLDRERVERERVERDRLERDRIDRERLDRDRLDRDRLDRERDREGTGRGAWDRREARPGYDDRDGYEERGRAERPWSRTDVGDRDVGERVGVPARVESSGSGRGRDRFDVRDERGSQHVLMNDNSMRDDIRIRSTSREVIPGRSTSDYGVSRDTAPSPSTLPPHAAVADVNTSKPGPVKPKSGLLVKNIGSLQSAIKGVLGNVKKN